MVCIPRLSVPWLAVLVAVAWPAAPAVARLARVTAIPLTRVLPNLERAVAEHPDDASAHFVLGRAHAAAFATANEHVLVDLRPRSDDGPRGWGIDAAAIEDVHATPREDADRPPAVAVQARHLARALRHLRRAVELQPQRAEHQLGLAHVLDVGADHASLVPAAEALGTPSSAARREDLEQAVQALGGPVAALRNEAWTRLADTGDDALSVLDDARESVDPAVRAAVDTLLAERWRAHAAQAYLRAWELAAEEGPEGDPPRHHGGPAGLRSAFVSYEAGEAWLRLQRRRPPRDDAERALCEQVSERLAEMEAAPGRISPVILALDRSLSVADLHELLAPSVTVTFDLDGDGRPEPRPWLAPETALLCWDPDGTGAITSGRQLFGNATWWLLFRDGYQALGALDDDGDGWLAGDELAGLAVWRDADQDGVSDPGEVARVTDAGIEALAVRASTRVGLHPAAERGVRLHDGRVLPTWDWIAPPVAKAPPAAPAALPD